MMNMLNMLHNDYSYRMIGNQKVKNIFFYIQKSSLYKNVSCLTHIILRKWTLNLYTRLNILHYKCCLASLFELQIVKTQAIKLP